MITSYVLSFILFKKMGLKDRLFALVSSVTINVFFVLFINEIRSIGNNLTFTGIVVSWIVILLCQIISIYFLIKKSNAFNDIKDAFKVSKIDLCSINTISALIILIAVFFAIRTVPYNWDSMSYHLSRIAHWTQQRSIAHYASHDISQISDPSLAEFIELQIYILCGKTDYLVNLLQTFAYFISAILVYGISGKIGCEPMYKKLAVLTYVTTPIVFAEALTTQVDIFAGMWLLMFAYIALDFIDKDKALDLDRANIVRLVFLGLAAGFSYDAKASASIGVTVFAIWLVLCCVIRKDKVGKIILSCVIVFIPAFLVVLPELARNINTFNAIAAAESSTDFIVPSFSPKYLIVNCAENITYNMPNKFFDVVMPLRYVVAYLLIGFFGSAETPAGLYDFNFYVEPTDMNHDLAINPLITWLMVLTIIVGIVRYIVLKVKKKKTECNWKSIYILVCILATLLFFTIAKWYKFITRYECGYFAILAPGVMLFVQILLKNKKELNYVFTGIVVFVCLASFNDSFVFHKQFLYDNTGRERAYFKDKEVFDQFNDTANEVVDGGYKNMGLIVGNDSYEYPLWKMTEGSVERIEHVCVDNETIIHEDGGFIPECIVAVDVETGDVISYHGNDYKLIKDTDGMKLYDLTTR